MKPCSGNIFQIQRWSINDGEGIRSTVFFKGCPLRCKWCANPESWNSKSEVMYSLRRCRGCGRCAQVCNSGAITMKEGAFEFERKKCIACFNCCKCCPTGSRKQVGSEMSVAEVLHIINRDAVFYRESGGGVTFSGGEPFVQDKFLRQLVTACKQVGIDTAVETCGYYPWEPVQDIFEQVDCVFMDIKHMDDKEHKRLTGVGNRKILKNIAAASRVNPSVIVRIPLIEGTNTGDQHIKEICEFLSWETKIKGIEILPYHDFGQIKFGDMGAEAHTFISPSPEKISETKKIIAGYGIDILDFR